MNKNPYPLLDQISYVEKDDVDFIAIRLLDKRFEGLVLKYGNVAFDEKENPDGSLTMHFNYDILENCNNIDTENEEFKTFLGDLILQIISEHLESGGTIEPH